jgi:flagellar hook assembly protein FlgD
MPPTATFTASATPAPQPYTVTINIYNSAGEIVKNLYSGDSEYPASQAQVEQNATGNGGTEVDITGLDGNAGPDVIWSGTNNGGQSVESGAYYVQISSTNSFGQTVTESKSVSIVSAAGSVTLGIYNSAGELVDNLSGEIATLSSEPTGMSLPAGQNGVVASTDPTQGGLKINLTLADGQTTSVFWDGMSSQGQPLQSGNYLVTLSQTSAGSSEVLKTSPVVLLATKDLSANGMANSALVLPNPVAGTWFDVQYQPASAGTGSYTAVGMLYDLAGQRVAVATDEGSGTLHFSGDWSSGIYLLDFEVHNGSSGTLARRVLKVAIVR